MADNGSTDVSQNTCALTEAQSCVGDCYNLTYVATVCGVPVTPGACQYCDPENTTPDTTPGLLESGACLLIGPASEEVSPECLCIISGNPQFIQHPINAPVGGTDCELCPEGS